MAAELVGEEEHGPVYRAEGDQRHAGQLSQQPAARRPGGKGHRGEGCSDDGGGEDLGPEKGVGCDDPGEDRELGHSGVGEAGDEEGEGGEREEEASGGSEEGGGEAEEGGGVEVEDEGVVDAEALEEVEVQGAEGKLQGDKEGHAEEDPAARARAFHSCMAGERARQTHPTGHRGELWMSRSPMTTEAE